MLAMRHQDLQQQAGIDGIILGPAGIKRFPELRQGLRVDRIQVQKIDIHQRKRIDQRSTLLLDSNSDGSTSEPMPQQLNPVLQRLRCLIQSEALPLVTVGFLQGNDVFLVGPIQSDECRDFDIRFRHLQISPWFPRLQTIPAGSARNPYSQVLEGHHLSIRSTSRADRARKTPSTVEPVGWLIPNATRPVFHKENSLLKEKRTKKENTKRPVENAAAIDIRKPSGGLRQLLLDADVHSCLEKRRKNARCHCLQYDHDIHTKTQHRNSFT